MTSQDSDRPSYEDNPYYEFQGLFCKVIIRRYDNRSDKEQEKALKGIIECKDEDLVSVKGDYQMTIVNKKDIVRCSVKPSGG